MTQLDGIWATEILSMTGWDRAGVTFLKDGHMHGGSKDFYHLGTYVIDGQNISMTLYMTSHSDQRQLYGKMRKKLTIQVDGTWRDGEIQGRAILVDPKDSDTTYNFRLVRLDDLPDILN